MCDHDRFSSYKKSQSGAPNGQDSWGASRELGALDGRILARAPASQLIKATTTMNLGITSFLILRDVTFEKREFR